MIGNELKFSKCCKTFAEVNVLEGLDNDDEVGGVAVGLSIEPMR